MSDDEEALKNSESSSDKKKEAKDRVVAPTCGETALPKESIKTQNVTNAPNLTSQPEATALKVIVVEKLRTDLSVNFRLIGETIASVTPRKTHSKK